MKRNYLLMGSFALIAAACAPVDDGAPRDDQPPGPSADEPVPEEEPAVDWTGYTARGNEPFWSLEMGEDRIAFDHFDRPGASAARPAPERTANGWRFAAEADDGSPFVVEIEDTVCQDSMSAQPFPHAVAVTVRGETYTGCGGETAALLTGGIWRVVRLGGSPLPAGIEQTLDFDREGRLTGSGGCNRYGATYRIRGPELVIGPMRSTRRACVGAGANELENRFFSLLGAAGHFMIAGDGALKLYGAGDDPAIVARR